jgi:DNA-binding transcriptional LysR family regulator
VARTTLGQWAVLASVVDEDGFGPAAQALHKSQSAVSYAIARLQEALGIDLLTIDGRKAVLSAHGKTLLKRARPLLRDLESLEAVAQSLKQGWEPELKLVVDVAFPRQRLLSIVAELQQLCPNTEIQVSDAVLSGAEEAITEHRADVVVTSRLPPDHLGELLLTVTFVAVAYPKHPLFELDRPLTPNDLSKHIQVVVRDSGLKHPRDEGWLGAERRCTVSSMEASLAMIKAGLGYAWLPEHLTSEAIHQGALRALPLEMGSSRPVSLHLVLVRPETSGPAATGGRRSLSTPSSLSRLTGEPRRCPDLHRHHGHLCPDGRNNSLHRERPRQLTTKWVHERFPLTRRLHASQQITRGAPPRISSPLWVSTRSNDRRLTSHPRIAPQS